MFLDYFCFNALISLSAQGQTYNFMTSTPMYMYLFTTYTHVISEPASKYKLIIYLLQQSTFQNIYYLPTGKLSPFSDKTKLNNSDMMKYSLTKLGWNIEEKRALGFLDKHHCSKSIHHDLDPSIFPTSDPTQSKGYSVWLIMTVKRQIVHDVHVCTCWCWMLIVRPANSPGFPGCLQVFHQISQSPG